MKLRNQMKLKNAVKKPDEVKKPDVKIHCEACNCYHAKKGKSQHIKTKKHMNNINRVSE
jgi:hypothetical protein